jgi:hypothetical protein
MNEEECPICFDKFGDTPSVWLNCCRNTINLNFYAKCVPKCPFCRSNQASIAPVHIIHTDWPRVTKILGASIIIGMCTSVVVALGKCDASHA